jgi:hypothetical protein
MSNSIVLKDLSCLPFDVINYTNGFISIDTMKNVRKIKPSEFPDEYKRLIQMKEDCFSVFENFKMICDTDDTAISMMNSTIQRNQQSFKRNLTACWFEYLDKELSLNIRLNTIKSQSKMNITCKEGFYNEYIKYANLVNNYGIISSL